MIALCFMILRLNLVIIEKAILVHNFAPIAIGVCCAFGGGAIELSSISLAIGVFGLWLIKERYCNNDRFKFGVGTATAAVATGGAGPRGPDDEENFFDRLKKFADKRARSGCFGNLYRDSETGLWWSKDRACHGGTIFKVFKEGAKGLSWVFDAAADGTQICNKHKGPVGLFIHFKDIIFKP